MSLVSILPKQTSAENDQVLTTHFLFFASVAFVFVFIIKEWKRTQALEESLRKLERTTAKHTDDIYDQTTTVRRELERMKDNATEYKNELERMKDNATEYTREQNRTTQALEVKVSKLDRVPAKYVEDFEDQTDRFKLVLEQMKYNASECKIEQNKITRRIELSNMASSFFKHIYWGFNITVTNADNYIISVLRKYFNAQVPNIQYFNSDIDTLRGNGKEFDFYSINHPQVVLMHNVMVSENKKQVLYARIHRSNNNITEEQFTGVVVRALSMSLASLEDNIYQTLRENFVVCDKDDKACFITSFVQVFSNLFEDHTLLPFKHGFTQEKFTNMYADVYDMFIKKKLN